MYAHVDIPAMLNVNETAFRAENGRVRVEAVKVPKGFSVLIEGAGTSNRRMELGEEEAMSKIGKVFQSRLTLDDIDVNFLLEPYVTPSKHPAMQR